MSKPLKITLIILAVLVVASIAYFVFLKSKKATDADIQALIDHSNSSSVDIFDDSSISSVRKMLPRLTSKNAKRMLELLKQEDSPEREKEFLAIFERSKGK